MASRWWGGEVVLFLTREHDEQGRRATMNAHPTPHHPPSPLRHLLVFS
jgi:hypothetical protein